ncbi:hypothetical protein M0805_000425 [Coniferiporia weirii]|nr:hypothetical protein M0805_000425 [Coniferiporia weirii]
MAVADAKPPQQSQDSASLVKRLAGPSVTKAGLAKDQTEINRIIAEASKGSKFYENEKRKDKELTKRIAKILKIKDDVMKEADIRRVEADADRLFTELEGTRDLSQTIVHVDMDAFYANVELLKNPSLEGKPFGVGKGVLSTASYEARKYGVRSGMAGFVAKKLCPELILVPVDFQKISEMSRKVMAIFRTYDPSMIVAGCDEGYLNITNYCNEHNLLPEECVRQMRDRVKTETGLTASAGIAPNKMLAKICSDKNKPNGQFHLPFKREDVVAFMRDLSIRKLPGVGRVNERLLESIGVKTCGDIYEYRAVLWLMDHYFGKVFLYKTHLGIASNIVQPHQREERKSIGAERTFNPIDNQDKILEKLEEVSVELENDMKSSDWAGKTVTLKYKLDTYQVFTRAKSFNRWITSRDDLFNTGKELLKPELPLRIRLIGLRVTKLKDLRAPADEGIERFFQTGTCDRPEPATKKRRVDSRSEVDDPRAALLIDAVDGDDAMPGFHEHVAEMDDWLPEEDDELFDDGGGEHVRSGSKPVSSSRRPSSPRRLADARAAASGVAEPESAQGADDPPPPRVQICPICAREVDAVDNPALNAHIDFCLSKDAIKQATASSGSTVPETQGKARTMTRTLSGWAERREKPPSGKRKGKK